MSNYVKKGCPRCSLNKNKSAHSYGKYYVYELGTNLKLVCATCGYVIKYKTIRGGVIYDESNTIKGYKKLNTER